MQILNDDSITQTIQYSTTVDENLLTLNKDQMLSYLHLTRMNKCFQTSTYTYITKPQPTRT